MLQVTVKIGRGLNKQEHRVIVHGFDRLTPRAAGAALEIATGRRYGGEVWTEALATPDGIDYSQMYGYRVYRDSARKLHPDGF